MGRTGGCEAVMRVAAGGGWQHSRVSAPLPNGTAAGQRVVACCVEHLRLVGSNAAQRQRRAVLPMRGGCAPFSSPLVTNCFLVCSTSSRAPASCRRQVEMATQAALWQSQARVSMGTRCKVPSLQTSTIVSRRSCRSPPGGRVERRRHRRRRQGEQEPCTQAARAAWFVT